MDFIKISLLKFFRHLIAIGDGNANTLERVEGYITTGYVMSLATILSTVVLEWYITNQKFILAIIITVVINMILGAWMHWQDGSFKLKILQNKTAAMVLGVGLVYLMLEMVISHGGENLVTQGFRNALQVTTLLYPASKILKNVFIITKGEYPPRWIMMKIYNFQGNGDLNAFINNNSAGNEVN